MSVVCFKALWAELMFEAQWNGRLSADRTLTAYIITIPSTYGRRWFDAFHFAYLLIVLVHYLNVGVFGSANSFATASLLWVLKYPHYTPVSAVIHKLDRRQLCMCSQHTRITRWCACTFSSVLCVFKLLLRISVLFSGIECNSSCLFSQLTDCNCHTRHGHSHMSSSYIREL